MTRQIVFFETKWNLPTCADYTVPGNLYFQKKLGKQNNTDRQILLVRFRTEVHQRWGALSCVQTTKNGLRKHEKSRGVYRQGGTLLSKRQNCLVFAKNYSISPLPFSLPSPARTSERLSAGCLASSSRQTASCSSFRMRFSENRVRVTLCSNVLSTRRENCAGQDPSPEMAHTILGTRFNTRRTSPA